MQQSCQHCGYESPAGAKFCRQCGATLFAETELSSTVTRNYGKQEPGPSVAVAGSGHLPPSVADAIAGETERYYRAPPVPVPPAPKTAPIKSKIRDWRWIVLFLVLLIGTAIGTAVTILVLPPRNPTPAYPWDIERARVENEERRRQQDLRREQQDRQREIADRIRNMRNRERDALNQQRDAFNQARQASEQASRAGTAFPPSNEKLIDLSSYEYDNATVRNLIRIPGHEMLTMRTSDSFEKLLQFYQKKLGNPVIRINESWEKRLVFQSSALPKIAVSIENDEENPNQLRIMVLRSPLWNFKPEEP